MLRDAFDLGDARYRRERETRRLPPTMRTAAIVLDNRTGDLFLFIFD